MNRRCVFGAFISLPPHLSKASRALREAAEVIGESPVALQLRHLQALSSIAAEHNSTIVFPVPVDIMGAFMQKEGAGGGGQRKKDE